MGCREEKEKPTLAGGPSRTEVKGREKKICCLSGATRSEFANFPAARNAGQAQRRLS